MPICKIKKSFSSTEGWQVGQTVDITNPWKLVEEGKVVLVDQYGNEMERPGAMVCPICDYEAKSALDLATHIFDQHPKTGLKALASVKKEVEVVKSEPVIVEPEGNSQEATKQRRINALKRARMVRRENLLKAKSEGVKELQEKAI